MTDGPIMDAFGDGSDLPDDFGVSLDTERFDAIAAELGYPLDWRAIGYDTPEYMESADSLYHVRDENDRPTGVLKCVWPGCKFRRRSVEAMFRHVHGTSHSGSSGDSA